ncbi:polyamine ABC transporter substrate-binding protein [Leisingera caerulea]|uniref:polyamine ABC transporter substrate-binding protein n=1 Tax=Leisingera caerulea TaxID=506591 RepID=UPI0021A616F0|nr:polyamine ABC transporter substrate-binding protein [Leisingera caerulea]UWQ82837.1 polyamine ABC transporter substrate-binding protein [Leisingera caerulea]
MRLTTIAAALAAAAAMAVPAAAEPGRVLLYNWSGYIAPETVAGFQEATGTRLVLDTYGEADEAEARLLARGTGYGLAVVSSETVGRLVEAGAIQQIGVSGIPNAAAIDQQLLQLYLDATPRAEGYALPYLWGTTGIAYDRSAVLERLPDAPLDSWALVFDPANASKLADCGITIVDSVEEVVAAALVYLGLDPQSRSEQDLEAAFEVLSAIAPYVRSFDVDQYDALLGGEVCLAVTWSTDGLAPLLEQGTDRYRYVMPREGTNLWADLFVIPSDAGDLEASHQLVDFLLRPDSMAQAALFTNAVSSITSTRAEAGSPGREIPAVTLPPEVRGRLYLVTPRSGEEKRFLDRRWRRLQIGM